MPYLSVIPVSGRIRASKLTAAEYLAAAASRSDWREIYGDHRAYPGISSHSCSVAPYLGQLGACGVCGAPVGERSQFCGDECLSVFVVNHNWDPAKTAVEQLGLTSCAVCGRCQEPDDEDSGVHVSLDLQVRHAHSDNASLRRGCHQHLNNLETVCRRCRLIEQRDRLVERARTSTASGTVRRWGNEMIKDLTRQIEAVDAPPVMIGSEQILAATSEITVEDMSDGYCDGEDPERWFSKLGYTAAKRLCDACPIQRQCARRALDLEVTDGVYAGVRLSGIGHLDKLAAAYKDLRRIAGVSEPAAAKPAEPVTPRQLELELAGA